MSYFTSAYYLTVLLVLSGLFTAVALLIRHHRSFILLCGYFNTFFRACFSCVLFLGYNFAVFLLRSSTMAENHHPPLNVLPQDVQPPNPAVPAPIAHRLAVKMPPFWYDKPASWFHSVEAQFHLQNIVADDTKYYYVVSALSEKVVSDVDDILSNPPPADKYQHLKTALITRLSLTQEQRIRQILHNEDLGGRKPSQFLRHLRSLAGTTPFPDHILRAAWCDRLPQAVQPIINAQLDLGLDILADVADRVMATLPKSASCLAVSASQPSTSRPTTTDVSALAAQVAELTQQMASLKAELQRRGRSPRPQSRSQPRPAESSSHPSNATRPCFYHARYGDEARKCQNPCNYKPGNAAGSQ